jgi:RNA polymerase sigma-70 factor (ECF subfamily)
VPDESWVQSRVERAQSGDLEAFGDLVESFQGPVRGFIAMLGAPADAVEDVAQETFLLAYRDLNRFERGKPFGPWLRGIARNLVRRHRTEATGTSRLKQEAVARLLAARDAEPDAGGFPDRFRKEHLLECLKLLPERSVALIRGKYADGRDSTAIARSMNVRPEAVRMALVRIRLKLRECIGRRMALENP